MNKDFVLWLLEETLRGLAAQKGVIVLGKGIFLGVFLGGPHFRLADNPGIGGPHIGENDLLRQADLYTVPGSFVPHGAGLVNAVNEQNGPGPAVAGNADGSGEIIGTAKTFIIKHDMTGIKKTVHDSVFYGGKTKPVARTRVRRKPQTAYGDHDGFSQKKGGSGKQKEYRRKCFHLSIIGKKPGDMNKAGRAGAA